VFQFENLKKYSQEFLVALVSLLLISSAMAESENMSGLLQIEIPASGQAKVFESALNTALNLVDETYIPESQLLTLAAPITFQVPRILTGKIRRPFEKAQVTSALSDIKIKDLVTGPANVECNSQQICKVTVFLLKMVVRFALSLTTEDDVLFQGKNLQLSIGHSDFLTLDKASIKLNNHLITKNSLANKAPSLTFNFKISDTGLISDQLLITQKPEIKIPENSLRFSLNIPKIEMDYAQRSGQIELFNSLYPQESNTTSNEIKIERIRNLSTSTTQSDAAISILYQGIGKALVEFGYFNNSDSYSKFMLLSILGKEYLFQNQQLLSLLSKQINEKIMPIAFVKANETIKTLKVLSQTSIDRPQISIQNIIDYPKNQEATSNILNKIRNYQIIDQDFEQYIKRYTFNSDYRSIDLLNQIMKSLFDFIPNSTDQKVQIENTQKIIMSNIERSQPKMNLNYDIQKIANHNLSQVNSTENSNGENTSLLLQIKSNQLTSSSLEKPITMEKPFATKCDLITHMSIESINKWLLAHYQDRLLTGCIRLIDSNVCSTENKKFTGDSFVFAAPPKLEWDESNDGYILNMPRINRDLRVSSFPITSWFGLTKDTVAMRLGFVPEPCANGDLCLKATSNLAFLKINKSSLLTEAVGIVKLMQVPYLIFGNALAYTSSSIVQKQIASSSFDLPKFKIAEIRNTQETISICTQVE